MSRALKNSSLSFTRLLNFMGTMQEFGVALGLWTVEEQTTNVYVTVVRDFTKDVLVYWMHISRDNTPFVQFKAEGTDLIPVLRYLHAIIAYTITGRSDSQTVVTATLRMSEFSHISIEASPST